MATTTTQQDMMKAKGYITIDAAARRCGLSVNGIYKLVVGDNPKVESVKIGKFRYIKIASLVAHYGPEAASALGLIEAPPPNGRRKA